MLIRFAISAESRHCTLNKRKKSGTTLLNQRARNLKEEVPPFVMAAAVASLGVFDGYLPLEHDVFKSMTKIGGNAVLTFPARLSPEMLQDIDKRTMCKACGAHMFLLAQAFAPLPGSSATHNRMLYTFACNSDRCSLRPDDAFVSFALQFDQPDTESLDANDDESDAPQPVEATPCSLLAPFSFPPLAVEIVDEPAKEVIVPTDVEVEMIKAAEANSKSHVADDDIAEMAHALDLKDKPIDVNFDKFRRRIARCPEQVLRYHRNGLALFMNPDRTIYLTVPPCAACGKERAMEYQLLPTLLYYCHTDKYVSKDKVRAKDEGLDFATVTVFACRAGCQALAAGTVLETLFTFVEAPPTMEEDNNNCGGKLTLREYFKQGDAPDLPGPE